MDITTDLALRLDPGVVRVATLLRSGGSSGAPETRVLVIAHGLLGQPLEHFMLFAA